jgi:hypothetical protein
MGPTTIRWFNIRGQEISTKYDSEPSIKPLTTCLSSSSLLPVGPIYVWSMIFHHQILTFS